MRRRGKIPAGVRAAALAFAVPAVLAGSALPAAASTDGTLVVTATDRQGEPLTVRTVSVTDEATQRQTVVATGDQVALAPGRYEVAVNIQEENGTDTLAGRVVTVTAGATAAVDFDARQGRAVAVQVDRPFEVGYPQRLTARICSDGHPAHIGAANDPGNLYVIPDPGGSTELGYLSTWTGVEDGSVWKAAGTGPLDDHPGGTVARASFGSVPVQVRRGPALDRYSALDVVPDDAGCDRWASTGGRFTTEPYASAYHLTPGVWNWTFGAGTTNFLADQTVVPGDNPGRLYNRAVWGPVRYLPWVQQGKLGFFTSGLFADPVLDGLETSINASATLYRGSTAVASESGLGNWGQGTVRTFWGPVSRSAWYTLKVHAIRHVPGVETDPNRLSSAVDVSFRFHAGPTSKAVAPGFLTRFEPAGLDLYNRTPAAGTSIALTLDRTGTQPGVPRWPSTAKKVEVFASADGGRSWQRLTVTHSGGAWTAHLPAQRPGASLSLSSRVTDTGGNQTVSTVYRAFTVA